MWAKQTAEDLSWNFIRKDLAIAEGKEAIHEKGVKDISVCKESFE